MQIAIAEMKFNGRRGLARYLGQVLGEAVAVQPWVHEIAGIVPVPLHPNRLAERGYNQAELLAEGVVRCLERDYGMAIPLMPALKRIVDTPHQVGQGRQGRLHNLEDAFAPAEGFQLRDQCLLIVDDVLTTGTTLRACAGSLRSAGAKRVYTAVAAGVFQFKS